MADRINVTRKVTYKGKYYLPIRTTVEYMQEFEDMELREDDIFICTYPKSGTHWMHEIVALILANGYTDKVPASHRRAVLELANVRLPTEEEMRATGPVLRELQDCPSPRLLSTHVPCPLLPRQRKEKHCKVIYVYRHPKDIVASYYNFHRFVKEGETGRPVPHTPEQFANFFDAFITGNFKYNSWFDHLKQYFENSDDPDFFFVSFEEMKKDVSQVVRDLVSFLGRDLDEDGVQRVVVNCSLSKMKATYKQFSEDVTKEGRLINPNIYVNKGTLKQWKNLFTAEQSEKFDKIFHEEMKNCEFTKIYSMVE